MGCLWSWCCGKPNNDDDDDDGGADSASTFDASDDSDDSGDDRRPLREPTSPKIRQRVQVQAKNKGWESGDQLQSVVDLFSAMDINR